MSTWPIRYDKPPARAACWCLHAIKTPAQVCHEVQGGWTAIMYAASAGQVGLVSQLLDAGAHVNAQAASGWTALSRAALKGHATVVETLLRAGADTAAANAGEGKVVLLHAVAGGCSSTHALVQAAMQAPPAASAIGGSVSDAADNKDSAPAACTALPAALADPSTQCVEEISR